MHRFVDGVFMQLSTINSVCQGAQDSNAPFWKGVTKGTTAGTMCRTWEIVWRIYSDSALIFPDDVFLLHERSLLCDSGSRGLRAIRPGRVSHLGLETDMLR